MHKLLTGQIFAPTKKETEIWQTSKKVTKLEVYYELFAIKIPEKKILGYNENNLPSLEYLLRSLK